ncbi:MAG: hypothetical protein ABSA18_14935 [Dehalococcoidia bacterium]|jgi:hypothetical protein
MSLPLIFAVFCGVFVAAVLGLAMWLIVTGLKEARRDKKNESGTEAGEPQ